jgi:competence ComEA-like helix-hairpin-helix protein
MKRILKDYFTFSKKERTAVIILLLLIVLFIVAPMFYRVASEKPKLNKTLIDFIAQNSASEKAADSAEEISLLPSVATVEGTIPHSLFSFDPNTLPPEGWKKLGLSDRTIRTIFNYRSKGGRFRSPEDIRKIWGIPKELAEQLVPYAHITDNAANTFNYTKKEDKTPAKHPVIIDINTASTEEWQALPGINSYMADRIVKYRERIGGFAGLDQVKKTYGINDSVFTLIIPYLKTDPLTTPKIDLNNASFYDLKNKANIPEPLARAILVYRQQYGPFASVSGLKKIVFINDSIYQRISPNLKVN